MNTFPIINRAIAFFAIIFYAYFPVSAQTLVYSNDFSANNNSTYVTAGAIGSSGYSVTRSGADWGGRIFNGYLDLTNDLGATGNASGWVIASISNTSFISPFTNTLSSNPGLVSWNFNMRQSRPDPAGFASGAYGVAFIIAGTSNTSATAGTGYAIVLGQSGTTDPIRLVRYSGGLQGTITNMITSNTTGLTDFGANYLSIRVNYTPATNTWELFLRNDGATAFAMPNSGTMTSQGTVTNNTYTSTSLPLMGGYWQGSTAAGEVAFFDQITIYVSPACTDVSLTSVTATDDLLCPTETTNITANGVAGTSAVLTWYTGPGGTGTNLGSTNTLTNRGPGTYYARITGDCGGPIEQSITINAASLPNTSSISGSATPACNASGVSYSVTNTVGSSYLWTVPSGATIAAGQGTSNITVNFGNTNGNVTVIETNAAGCTGSAVTLSITLAGCGLDANFSTNQPNVCSGGTVTFTNTSTGASGGATYSWNFGTGAAPATATGIGPHDVIYNGSGNATVTLTIVDGVTNVETKTNFITISALPGVNVGGALTAICRGATTAALGGSFSGAATGAIWSDGGAGGTFSNNTGTTPNTATYTASLTAPSTVTLTLSSAGGSCGIATGTKTLTVNAIPAAPIANGNISPQLSNVANTSFQANWNTVSGSTSYQINVSQLTSATITETFTNVPTISSTSYATRPWTGVGGITYTAFKSRSDQTITASNPAITLQDAADSYILSGTISGNPTGVYFDVQQKFGGSGGQLTIAIEHGAGFSTVTTLGTIAYSTTTQTNVGFPASGITGPFRIRISNNAAARPCIDNLDILTETITPISGSPFTTTSTPLNITGLTQETQYLYNVVAINACGSSAASNNVFVTTSCPSPTTNASTFVITTTSASSLNLAWTNGNGSNRIIVARASLAPTGTPSNSITYAFNTNFSLAPALGDGVTVYNGNGSSTTVTGLTAGTLYYFAIYEYNCGVGAEQYLVVSPVTASGTTNPNNVSLSENCTTNSSHQLSWTFGSGLFDGVKIFARAVTTPSTPTAQDANFYTGANSEFNLAADYGTRGKLVYDGTGTNVTITGLTAGVNYIFAAYTYKNNTSTRWSSGTTVSQTISLNNVSGANASIGDQLTNLGWANPIFLCYDEILVVANQGAVVFTPSGDGSAYTPNTIYTASNQVVYKGTGQTVSITGLTNGLNYCYRIFVRLGTQWSSGIEVCAIPNAITEFEPGDLAIVAVNTQVLGTGSTDEVCFVAFKDITENTSFFMTDNGFERSSAELWGDTEGVMRMTRVAGAPIIPAGTVICVNGPYTTDPLYDIIVCGVLDNANWQIDANVIGSGAASFDLNSQDQVWIMQGGSWANPSGNQNATYNGNLLYGWSGISWRSNIGSTPPLWTTQGSRLIPGTECFTSELSTVTNNDKTKYTGPLTETTRLGWISRINNPSNWAGYSSNANYDGAGIAYDYINECITFPIAVATEVAGRWTGAKDVNWFDCNNWDTKTVPDNTIDVVVDNVAGANNLANIDFNAAFAYLYDNEASCRNLTINAKQVRLTGNVQDILNINGNLTIGAAGLLNMDDGTAAADGVVTITGNWNNSANAQFAEGNGTVEFSGNTLQTIAAPGGEQFYNLTHNNSAAVGISNNTIVSNALTMNAGNINTAANILTLGTSSSNAGTLSYVSGIINGNFRRWNINSGVDYRFPIGTSTSLHEVTINHQTAPTPGTITASFTASDPGSIGLPLYEPNGSVQQQFSQGYWNITGENGLVANDYNLTLLGNGFSGPTFDENARIIFRENNEPWELTGTHLDATAPLARRASLNVFGEFGIASARECVTSFSAPNIVNQETCENGTLIPFAITPTDGSGTLNYQWYQTPVNSNASGESLGTFGGAQTTTFSPPSDAPGTIYYYLEVTQPGTICPAAVSSVVSVTISEIITPTVTIASSALGLNSCSNESITFTANAMFAGTSPNYQWFVNSIPVGSNQNTYTFTPTAGPQEVYVSIISSDVCNNGQAAQSNVIAFNTINPSNFYQDLDDDGFGNPLVFINACEAPSGYVALSLGDLNGDGQPDFDCNDNNEDINPAAEEYCSVVDDDCDNIINEGLSATIYYADSDGDGFGDPAVFLSSCTPILGYVINNTDCNDNNAQANPLINEVCNGFDDDCDSVVDEFCGPVNDEYLTGFILPLNSLGNCSNITGTLLGANPSVQANSIAVTGQDVWYYFTAVSPGVSVVCQSATNDVILELQDDLGNTLDIENQNASSGTERLNFAGLTLGNTYFIAVRNNNSNVAVGGAFSICAQRLNASKCDANTNTLTVNKCGNIKADFTNANQYVFRFNATTIVNGTFAASVAGSSNTIAPLLQQSSIAYGAQYSAVFVDAIYHIPNGLGSIEIIVIPGVTPTTVNVSPQPSLQIRAADSCPNARSLSAVIRAEPHICGGVADYQWEFTQVLPTPGLPVVVNRGAPDRLFRTSWIPGAVPGATYSVRIRPVFSGNIFGSWSANPSCLSIIGSAGFALDESELNLQPNERSFGFEDSSFSVNIYPNPNNGEAITLAIGGAPSGVLRVNITDAIGRKVSSLQYQVEYRNLTTQLDIPQALQQGAYFVEIITADNRREVLRVIVQK